MSSQASPRTSGCIATDRLRPVGAAAGTRRRALTIEENMLIVCANIARRPSRAVLRHHFITSNGAEPRQDLQTIIEIE
jgi:hypothetical protein